MKLGKKWGLGFLLSALAFGNLSAQTQYSIGSPTNSEQYMLELINRARADGAAEAARSGLSGLQEGPPNYNGEVWTIQNSNQPLSWNPNLASAAQDQATNLNNGDQFFLGGSPHTYGGMTPEQRTAAAGYSSAAYNGPTTSPSHYHPGSENVAEEASQGSGGYIGTKLAISVANAQSGLFTDQTVPGRGHRNTMMLGFFREVGIGISTGKDNQSNPGQPGGTWDSFYAVQDFGTQPGATPFLTGVVYQDTNGNGSYDAGEGIGGVRVDVAGANYYAITSSSGGYSVPLPANGSYTATFSGNSVASVQRAFSITNDANAKVDYVATQVVSGPTRLGNISSRAVVGTGDNALIGGFIVSGTQPKKVIVRAIGPSLSVPGKLANPQLELYNSSGVLIGSNDNWRTDQQAEIQASTVPPSDDLEAAIVATLPANNSSYTAIVRGVNGATGVGVVEVYDLDPAADSQLANISSRAYVQTNDNVLIAGFILTGNASRKVIVRAIGPSLTVPNALSDTTLELFDNNGTSLASNDNWRSDQEAEIVASTVAPSNDLESAIVRTLAPASYTAIVRGKNNTSGVAVVEVYSLN